MSDSDSDIDREVNCYIREITTLSHNEFSRKKALQMKKPKNIHNFDVEEIMFSLKTVNNLDKFCVGETLMVKFNIDELYEELIEIKKLCRQIQLEKDDYWAKTRQQRKEVLLPNIEIDSLQNFFHNEDLIEEQSFNDEVEQPRPAAPVREQTDELFGHVNLIEALEDVTSHNVLPEPQPILFHGDSQSFIAAQAQDEKYFENLFIDKSVPEISNIQLTQVDQLPIIQEHQLQQPIVDQYGEIEEIQQIIEIPQVVTDENRTIEAARVEPVLFEPVPFEPARFEPETQRNLRVRHPTSSKSVSPLRLVTRTFNKNKMTKFRDLKLHVQTYPPSDREELICHDTVHLPVVTYLLNIINEIVPAYPITRAMSQQRDITEARMSHGVVKESQNIPHVSEIVSESLNVVHQEQQIVEEKGLEMLPMEQPINMSDIPQLTIRDFTIGDVIMPMNEGIIQSTPIAEFRQGFPLNSLELVGHGVK